MHPTLHWCCSAADAAAALQRLIWLIIELSSFRRKYTRSWGRKSTFTWRVLTGDIRPATATFIIPPPLQKAVHPRQPAEHRGVLPHRRRHRPHQLGHSREPRQYIYHLPCIYPDSISISRVIVIKCFACKNNLNHDLCISNNNGRNYERDNK